MRVPVLASLAALAALAVSAGEAPSPSPPRGEGRDLSAVPGTAQAGERSESGVRARAWPLWEGSEPVEQYARRARLPPTQTLDLGNGVKLEMVLIPAGKFTIGTPEPEPVDEEAYVTRIWVGRFALGAGTSALLVLLGVVAIRAIRQRRRPQYSLARLLVMTVVAGVALLGGLHWCFSANAFSDAKPTTKRSSPASDTWAIGRSPHTR